MQHDISRGTTGVVGNGLKNSTGSRWIDGLGSRTLTTRPLPAASHILEIYRGRRWPLAHRGPAWLAAASRKLALGPHVHWGPEPNVLGSNDFLLVLLHLWLAGFSACLSCLRYLNVLLDHMPNVQRKKYKGQELHAAVSYTSQFV